MTRGYKKITKLQKKCNETKKRVKIEIQTHQFPELAFLFVIKQTMQQQTLRKRFRSGEL